MTLLRKKRTRSLSTKEANERLKKIFTAGCHSIGLPDPLCEYVPPELIKTTGRRFRLDFAFPEIKLGIEIDGAIWVSKRGHSSGSGILRDIQKLNALTESGWWLLRFDGSYSRGRYTRIDFDQILRVYKRLSECKQNN